MLKREQKATVLISHILSVPWVSHLGSSLG
jgi:hypothetical protein